MVFWWTFGFLSALFILGWIGKKIGSAYPLGCGIVIIIFILVAAKACSDMEKEEMENKNRNEQRMDRLKREMKETEYMRTSEYQHKEYMKKYRHEEE